MKHFFLAFSALMFGLEMHAQHGCQHKAQMDKMHRAHPEWIQGQKARRIALEHFTHQHTQSQAACTSEDIVVPIVFHVVHDNGPENISDAQIHEAIVQLNEDFSASNPELPNVHPNFTGLVADVGMQFRLADFDPNGQPTTGINRIQSDLTYNGSNLALKQMIQWDPTMYLNVWVVNSSDGGNGSAFAFYPGDVEGSASVYDGIVSSYWAVGRTETAVWTHYKILTHEVGHWANLKHTWGDESYNSSTAGCAYDDGVDDTPNTIGNTGCNLEAASCGSQDNVQNYMDYSNCSNMFTEGQKARMLATMCSDVAGRNHIWSEENHAVVFLQDDFLPRIVYQDQTFQESYANDGSIDSALGLELLDLSFSATGTLVEGLDFTAANLPAGTSLSVTVTDATHATVTLEGQVGSHTTADNLNNLELHFTAAPFAGVTYEDIYNPSNTGLGVAFLDPYEVVFVDLVDDAHNFFEGRRWTWFTMGSGGADFGFFHHDLVNIKLETYGNGAVCHLGTSEIVPLPHGTEVGPGSNITEPGPWYPDQLDLSNPTYTDWNGQTAYAGVSFQKNGNTHYGWIRMSVSEDGTHYFAHDMAYNEAPDGPITTGEVEEPVLAYTQTTFHEAAANDGSLSSTRAVDVFGATWSEFDVLDGGDGFTVSNLPSGLAAKLQRDSDRRAILSLVGEADDHANQDDQDINVSFTTSLLSDAAPGMSLNRWMSLDFADPYGIEHVVVDPSEGIMVANPGNNWKYFDLGVGDAEFGLWYVNNHFRFETYSKSGVCNTGSTNLAALQAGAVIGEPSNWEYFSELETQLVITSPSYSDWDGQIAYAGFKFTIAERFHYGWMMFEVAPDGNMVQLLEYAYNRKPFEEIVAGQIYADYGCTDPDALNYNPFAIEDDGTCEYPLDCGDETTMFIQMTDSYGDGWNGNVLEFVNAADGTTQSVSLNNGSSGTDEFCLPDGCYTFSAGSGSYLYEIGWELYAGDVLVASGSGDESGYFSLNGDCSVLNGCTDPEAYNHNPLAIFDDGSCIYPVVGCTDPEALNYDADAEFDDGSCYYDSDILGCTDDGATNYNPAATYDDGSCFYPELEFDVLASEWCVGETMTITWTGGDADALIYVGLINVTANAAAASLGTVPNTGSFEWVVEDVAAGSALTYRLYLEEQPYPPTTWAYSDEFEILDDCEVTVPGCTDASACNFNPDATEDDGTCLYDVDALGECGGDCEADVNGDGVCDPTCPADLDGDGVVATQDVLLILSEFGCTSGCTTDVNLDGFVAIDDFLFLLGEFGNTCE